MVGFGGCICVRGRYGDKVPRQKEDDNEPRVPPRDVRARVSYGVVSPSSEILSRSL